VQIAAISPTFAQGATGEAIAVIGSSGYLEIAMNKANAARALGVARGAEVTVELG
jgi:S-adenosylmethionine hydrolase